MARKRTSGDPSGYTLLVVDDQEETLASVKLLLEREGHRVLLADSGSAALEIFAREPIHALLVDYFMPRMTGEELIAAIRARDKQVQIVLQTGYSGEKPPREMLHHLDIQGYHDKSEGPEKLLLWVDVALKSHEHLRRVREAELLKSQLLANISHEFRTPLHIILGYTEILGEEPSDGHSRTESLDRIRENAAMLLNLVNDFLSLSDLDSGTTVPRATALDPGMLRTEFDRSASTLIRDKPLEFLWRVGDDLPAVTADPARLRVIVMNLLSNAVKFTPAGVITVSGHASPDAVTLVVQDTGIGIAAEHHERIFETFRQLDGSDSRSQGGTGIGLPIARKLARLMGGDITVSSRLGEGAAFALRLPRAHLAPREEPVPQSSDGEHAGVTA